MDTATHGLKRCGSYAIAVTFVWALVIVVPLRSLMIDDPTYLIAHQRSEWSVLGLSGLILIIVFLLTLVTLRLATLLPLNDRLAQITTLSLLLAVPSSSIVARVEIRNTVVLWVAVSVIAVACAAAIEKIKFVTNLFRTALAVLVFVLIVSSLIDSKASSTELEVGVWTKASPELPDVLVVILDEVSWLDLAPDLRVVDQQFLAISELQKVATTYTEAYSTYPFTDIALPSIWNAVTDVSSLNKAEIDEMKFRTGIFGQLAERYALSPISFLPEVKGQHAKSVSANNSFATFVKDAWALFGRKLLPEYLARQFPDVNTRWVDFFAVGDSGSDETESYLSRTREESKPSFREIHLFEAHHPWTLDNVGRLMSGKRVPLDEEVYVPFWCRFGFITCTEAHTELSYRLHLNGIRQADKILGSVFETLREEKRFDDTLIILTSDHGISIDVGIDGRRPPSVAQKTRLASVPLIVKYPGQESAVFSGGLRSIAQIMPTIAKAVGLEAELNGVADLGEPISPGVPFAFVNQGRPSSEVAGSLLITPDISSQRSGREKINLSESLVGLGSPAAGLVGKRPPVFWGDVDLNSLTNSVVTYRADSPLSIVRFETSDPFCIKNWSFGFLLSGSEIVRSAGFFEPPNGGSTRGWAIWPIDFGAPEVNCRRGQ